ncbi:unnamed protein product [Musa acuminata var. zebrina]
MLQDVSCGSVQETFFFFTLFFLFGMCCSRAEIKARLVGAGIQSSTLSNRKQRKQTIRLIWISHLWHSL